MWLQLKAPLASIISGTSSPLGKTTTLGHVVNKCVYTASGGCRGTGTENVDTAQNDEYSPPIHELALSIFNNSFARCTFDNGHCQKGTPARCDGRVERNG